MSLTVRTRNEAVPLSRGSPASLLLKFVSMRVFNASDDAVAPCITPKAGSTLTLNVDLRHKNYKRRAKIQEALQNYAAYIVDKEEDQISIRYVPKKPKAMAIAKEQHCRHLSI